MQLRTTMEIKPIAHIQTPFKEKFGVPRQSGRVAVKGRIVFEKEYRNPDALRGVEEFSHFWLLFDFSLAHRAEFCPTVRPPRLGGNQKVGVFASRSPFRPNNIGLSLVKLLSVEHDERDGDCLIVEGADLIDGTPIYDIKPYVPTDCVKDAVCSYADKHFYDKLQVVWACDEDINAEEKRTIIECIQEDPRPSYQDDDREYGMIFNGYNVRFKVENGVATVFAIESTER